MCNKWCIDFIRAALPLIPRGPVVLEVGSRNVNGSPRDAGIDALVYVGVDLEDGPGVDVVCDVDKLDDAPLSIDVFDVVISTEMLEHVADWQSALIQMAFRVASGGLLILTTRSPGFEYHPYPLDKWRFTLDDMRAIFAEGWDLLTLEPDPDTRNGVYCGVGIVARCKMSNAIQLARWAKHLATIDVMEVHG